MHPVQEKAEDTVYDYMVREDGAGWQHWQPQVHAWIYPKDQERPKFARLAIPTTESVRYEYLLSLVHAAGKVRPHGDWASPHKIRRQAYACSVSSLIGN